MSRHTGRLLIGTSGWSYQHWKGSFYPEKLSDKEMLRWYAHRLRSTEINSSFYRLPSRATLEHWRESVPEGFVFSAKASRYITHMKKLKDCADNAGVILQRLSNLEEKLGPLLFQLPPHWRFNLQRLTHLLQALPETCRYAFEFRDPSWQDDRCYDSLRAHNAALCIYDLEGVTSPAQITADFVYLRLHGPEHAYRGSYPPAALRPATHYS
jgi:uncharacterized protein YecE (DUF72 family)